MVITTQTKLVNQVKISSSDIQSFKEKGFLKIENLLSPEAISRLKELARAQVQSPVGEYADSEMSKLKYGLNDSIIKKIYSSPEFSVLNEIAQKRLLFLQGVGFQIEPEKKGFDWHVGVYSFNFCMPEDFGCSLWIPLDVIDTKKQHGGMSYAPTDIISARSYFSSFYRLIQDDRFIEALRKNELKRRFDIAPELDTFLAESNKIEDDFELGDVLLFNKFVWHKSCPLKQGDLKSRTAFVMRFCSDDASCSKTYFERLNLAMKVLNNNTQNNFGSEFLHLDDGNLITKSSLIDNYIGTGI